MQRAKVLESMLVLSMAPLLVHLLGGGRHWLWLAFAVGAIGILWPWASAKIAWAWQQLAHILGQVNGTILLSLVFLLLVWPIGLMARLLGRTDRLQRERRSDSYFHHRNHTFTKDDIQDPW